MSRDLFLVACSGYLFLVTLFCFVRYVTYHQERPKVETWRKHGTPYKARKGWWRGV